MSQFVYPLTIEQEAMLEVTRIMAEIDTQKMPVLDDTSQGEEIVMIFTCEVFCSSPEHVRQAMLEADVLTHVREETRFVSQGRSIAVYYTNENFYRDLQAWAMHAWGAHMISRPNIER